MVGDLEAAKVRVWRDRFSRFDDRADQDGRVTVEKFCQDEGVSMSSFYNWQRKLARPKRRTSPMRQRQGKAKPTAGRGVFEPVTIAATTAVAIRLPGGTLIEVPAGSDSALRTALQVIVGQLMQDQREADPC